MSRSLLFPSLSLLPLLLFTAAAHGVFLGKALMRLLSDSNATSKPYLFAFRLACAGYLLTILACLIRVVYGKQRNGSSGDVELQGNGNSSGNGRTSESQYQVHGGTDNHFVKGPLATATSLGDSVLLIVALCYHSLFQGIAIVVEGIEGDAWKVARQAVSPSMIFLAVAMGIALLRMIPDRLFSCAAYAFAFAISSPTGVAIGIIIDATTQGAVADWIYAISMGLACGVFIYVSINHLLSKRYAPKKSVSVDTPHYKFLAFLLSTGVVSAMADEHP